MGLMSTLDCGHWKASIIVTMPTTGGLAYASVREGIVKLTDLGTDRFRTCDPHARWCTNMPGVVARFGPPNSGGSNLSRRYVIRQSQSALNILIEA